MTDQVRDFYKDLGVPRNAKAPEIKQAYRDFARSNHPDLPAIQNLPEQEKELRVRQMYDVNFAYETLKDEKKRAEYDERFKESQHARSAESTQASTQRSTEGRSPSSSTRGAMRRPQARRESYADVYASMFGDLFKDGGIFGSEGSFLNFGNVRKQKDYFLLSETDMGLLLALRKAYEAEEDGEWRVKKGEGDGRNWMPEQVYSVKRKQGKVHVFRRITDWRNRWDREDKIEVLKEGSLYKIEKEYEPDVFFG